VVRTPLDALAAQTELLAALRLGGNLDTGGSVQRGNLDLATQCGVAKLIGISQCRCLWSRWEHCHAV